jgi:hypothetical protein
VAGTVARGTPVTFLDVVHDGGGHGNAVALVQINGQPRFVPVARFATCKARTATCVASESVSRT